MPSNNYPIVDYGFTQALNTIFPSPIVALRNPTTADKGALGQIWVNKSSGSAFILVAISNNSYTWTGFNSSGSFSSLTVTPGPIALTGTTTINNSGTATTTIGGGSGAVTIGSGTGNTTIGNTSGASSTTIQAGTGNINLAGTLALSATGPQVLFGSGVPAASVPKGSIYINTTAITPATRLYIATDNAGTWASFTASA